MTQGATLTYMRCLDIGTDSLRENAEPDGNRQSWIAEFVDQFEQTLKAAYQHSSGEETIEQVYIGGAEEICTETGHAIHETSALPVSCIESDLVQNCESSTTDSISHQYVSLQPLFGLLKSPREKWTNLLPPLVLKDRKLKYLRREITRCAVMIFLLIAALALVFHNSYHRRVRYLEYLNEEIARTRSTASLLSGKREKIRMLTEHIEQGRTTLLVVSEVYRIVPPNIRLIQINYSSDNVLTLKGETSDMSHVIDLTPLLEKSHLFDNVRVKYATRAQRDKDVIDFEISSNIR
jgi:hypothetical protein